MQFSTDSTYRHKPRPGEIELEKIAEYVGMDWVKYASVEMRTFEEGSVEEVVNYLGRDMFVALAKINWGYHDHKRFWGVLRALKEGLWTPEVITTLLYSVGGRAGGGIMSDNFGFPGVIVRGRKVIVTPDDQRNVGRWIGKGGSRIKAINAVAITGGWEIVIQSPR